MTSSISCPARTTTCARSSRSSRLERDISRRRRILHGELDILRAELVMRLQRKHAQGESVISANDVEGLSRILAGRAPTTPSPSPSPPRATTRTRRTSVFCPECGIRNSEGASFCVRCGASLIADQPGRPPR